MKQQLKTDIQQFENWQRETADIAEYACKYGIPFDEALEVFNLACGKIHVRRMIAC